MSCLIASDGTGFATTMTVVARQLIQWGLRVSIVILDGGLVGLSREDLTIHDYKGAGEIAASQMSPLSACLGTAPDHAVGAMSALYVTAMGCPAQGAATMTDAQTRRLARAVMEYARHTYSATERDLLDLLEY